MTSSFLLFLRGTPLETPRGVLVKKLISFEEAGEDAGLWPGYKKAVELLILEAQVDEAGDSGLTGMVFSLDATGQPVVPPVTSTPHDLESLNQSACASSEVMGSPNKVFR